MKHLALILIVLVFGNKTQEKSITLQSNNFSSQKSISTQEINLESLENYNIETMTNSQLPPIPVRIKFYNTTTQQQINESLDIINPLGRLRCVDTTDPVYVIFIPGKGRSSGSGGSRDDDNVIKSIIHIQSYTFGAICD